MIDEETLQAQRQKLFQFFFVRHSFGKDQDGDENDMDEKEKKIVDFSLFFSVPTKFIMIFKRSTSVGSVDISDSNS